MITKESRKSIGYVGGTLGIILLLAATPTMINWQTQIKNYNDIDVTQTVVAGGCGMTANGSSDQSSLLQTCLTTHGTGVHYIFPAGVFIVGNVSVGDGVATTSFTKVTAGSSPTITVDDTTNIISGSVLTMGGGNEGGNAELVTVSSVNPGARTFSISGTLSYSHGVSYNVSSATNGTTTLLTLGSNNLYPFGGDYITITGFTGSWSAVNGVWTTVVPTSGPSTTVIGIPIDSTSFGSMSGSPVVTTSYNIGKLSSYNNVLIEGKGRGSSIGSTSPVWAGITEFRYPNSHPGNTPGTYTIKFSSIAGSGLSNILVNGSSNQLPTGYGCSGNVADRAIWVDSSNNMKFENVSAACGNAGSNSIVLGRNDYTFYVYSNSALSPGCMNMFHNIEVGPTMPGSGSGGMGFDSSFNNGYNGRTDVCSNHVDNLHVLSNGAQAYPLFVGRSDNDEFRSVLLSSFIDYYNVNSVTVSGNTLTVGITPCSTPSNGCPNNGNHWLTSGRSASMFLEGTTLDYFLRTAWWMTATDSSHLTATIPSSISIPTGTYTGSGTTVRPTGLLISDIPSGLVGSHSFMQINTDSGIMWYPETSAGAIESNTGTVIGNVSVYGYISEAGDSMINMYPLLVVGNSNAGYVSSSNPANVFNLILPYGSGALRIGKFPLPSTATTGFTNVLSQTGASGSEQTNFGSAAGGFYWYTANGLQMTMSNGGGLGLPNTPTSAGSGGLYLCVDSSGNVYKRSVCP